MHTHTHRSIHMLICTGPEHTRGDASIPWYRQRCTTAAAEMLPQHSWQGSSSSSARSPWQDILIAVVVTTALLESVMSLLISQLFTVYTNDMSSCIAADGKIMPPQAHSKTQSSDNRWATRLCRLKHTKKNEYQQRGVHRITGKTNRKDEQERWGKS